MGRRPGFSDHVDAPMVSPIPALQSDAGGSQVVSGAVVFLLGVLIFRRPQLFIRHAADSHSRWARSYLRVTRVLAVVMALAGGAAAVQGVVALRG